MIDRPSVSISPQYHTFYDNESKRLIFCSTEYKIQDPVGLKILKDYLVNHPNELERRTLNLATRWQRWLPWVTIVRIPMKVKDENGEKKEITFYVTKNEVDKLCEHIGVQQISVKKSWLNLFGQFFDGLIKRFQPEQLADEEKQLIVNSEAGQDEEKAYSETREARQSASQIEQGKEEHTIASMKERFAVIENTDKSETVYRLEAAITKIRTEFVIPRKGKQTKEKISKMLQYLFNNLDLLKTEGFMRISAHDGELFDFNNSYENDSFKLEDFSSHGKTPKPLLLAAALKAMLRNEDFALDEDKQNEMRQKYEEIKMSENFKDEFSQFLKQKFKDMREDERYEKLLYGDVFKLFVKIAAKQNELAKEQEDDKNRVKPPTAMSVLSLATIVSQLFFFNDKPLEQLPQELAKNNIETSIVAFIIDNYESIFPPEASSNKGEQSIQQEDVSGERKSGQVEQS